jgi:hypothetical protein
MLDQSKLNSVISIFEVTIEPGRVDLFRKAIGEEPGNTPTVPGELAPPTIMGFGLDPQPFDFVEIFSRDMRNLLHANQSIRYLKPIRVGDVLQGTKRVAELFDKKDGQLEFLVLEIEFRNPQHKLVCVSRQTLVFVQKKLP